MSSHGLLALGASLLVACAPRPEPPATPRAQDPAVPAPDAAGAEPGDAAPPGQGSGDGGRSAVRVTPRAAARCGPDYVVRQPGALADLDRDGALERVSVVRDGDQLIVRLHRVPGLAVAAEWRLRGDAVEVGTTRCAGRTDGDLWLHVGVAHDPRGERWTQTLYHLEGGQLAASARDVTQSNLFFDVDGDGCVDPIVADAGGGGRILRRGAWARLPRGFEPMRLAGLPFGHGQSRSTDLDGDGDPDLLMTTSAGVDLVDATTLRASVLTRGSGAWAHVTEWQGRTVIVISAGGALKVLAADAGHAELASIPAESYERLVPDLDPAGDGSVLAVESLATRLLDARTPDRLVDTGVELARPLDRVVPRLGPVRVDGDGAPDLLGVRVLEAGHPMIAFPGSTARYELQLLRPPGLAAGRVIRTSEVNGDLGVGVQLVDLERDGTYEIVLTESAGYSSCDMSSSATSATLSLLDGDGTVLWQDEERHEYHGGGWRPSVLAHARALDLWGDGSLAVRVRAGDLEWYLLAEGAPAPDPMPICLE